MTFFDTREIAPVAISALELPLPDGRIVRVSVKYMQPDEAGELLKHNQNNRPINKLAVADMVRDIQSGDWEFNGDTIKIAEGPLVLDAQHRLTAIHQAGVAVPVVLVENLDRDVADTIDQGRPRSVGDILRLRYGRTELKNETTITAMALMLMTGRENLAYRPKRQEIAEYANRHYETLISWAAWSVSVSHASQRVAFPGRRTIGAAFSSAAVGTLAICMVDDGADAELVIEFLDRVSNGSVSDKDQTNIIPALRKRQANGVCLSRSTIASGGASFSQMWTEFATYINAYNRWVCNEPVSIIKGQKELVKSFADLPAVSRIGT